MLKNLNLVSRSTWTTSFVFKGADGKELEVDFAMLTQGKPWAQPETTVILGECKTFGDIYVNDVERMAQVARMFPGCVLVFATMKEHVNSDEQKLLSEFAALVVNPGSTRYWF